LSFSAATGGIGAALGRQLTPLGCRLTLAARDQSRLDTLSGELHAEACSVEATDSDAIEDAVWMAQVTEGCANVWSYKRLARNQLMAMQLKNLSRLDKDSRRDIREDAGRIRY
jgi:hypothetical protein